MLSGKFNPILQNSVFKIRDPPPLIQALQGSVHHYGGRYAQTGVRACGGPWNVGARPLLGAGPVGNTRGGVKVGFGLLRGVGELEVGSAQPGPERE